MLRPCMGSYMMTDVRFLVCGHRHPYYRHSSIHVVSTVGIGDCQILLEKASTAVLVSNFGKKKVPTYHLSQR